MQSFLLNWLKNFQDIIIYTLGGHTLLLDTFLTIIMLDILTSIIRIIINKPNRKIAITNIIKNIGYFILLALTTALDNLLGDTIYITSTVLYAFIITKALAITSKWQNLGLKIPNIISETLEEIENKTNEK